MSFEIARTKYTGTVKEVIIGTGEKSVKIGGESCYPFYVFEGKMPNLPKVAFDVWDYKPDDWQPWAVEPYQDVIHDPLAWAKKCVDVYGAELIALQLKSADPNGMNRDIDEIIGVVRKVVNGVDVPLIIWGTANEEKDTLMLKKVAEVCEGKNVLIGPVSDKNYKQLGATAIAYSQIVGASTPIDVNLAKQLNILLGNLGVTDDKIVMDPTTGALGYGLEYVYSVMERDRMAALTQEDTKLQYPIISNLAPEVWKTRETKITMDEDRKMGDERKRSILMESLTAMSVLLAGADVVVMRHPESIALIKEMIQELAG
ncbi:MAG TPA: acetyl-CoA decarbonylase/synthase complex subunit delta [Syntrophorhabdaceae bacterium]|nr:acetyl-CoA decarbonylase/synthase complex subunit delta [Syntrophorhabdaceae bacterium]